MKYVIGYIVPVLTMRSQLNWRHGKNCMHGAWRQQHACVLQQSNCFIPLFGPLHAMTDLHGLSFIGNGVELLSEQGQSEV